MYTVSTDPLRGLVTTQTLYVSLVWLLFATCLVGMARRLPTGLRNAAAKNGTMKRGLR